MQYPPLRFSDTVSIIADAAINVALGQLLRTAHWEFEITPGAAFALARTKAELEAALMSCCVPSEQLPPLEERPAAYSGRRHRQRFPRADDGAFR